MLAPQLAALAFAIVVVIFVALVIGANSPTSTDSRHFDRALFFRSAAWRFLQTLLIGVGLVCIAWHSLDNASGPDATSLSFMVMVIIVVLVPVVEKIVFPG